MSFLDNIAVVTMGHLNTVKLYHPCLHDHLCYTCNTCVVFVGVLHVEKYMCITCVADICVIRMCYTCNACVGYAPVLHV